MDYVAYYRVSTAKQSLGIDAQRTMVCDYLKGKLPIASFTERESAKCDKNRPELQKALDLAKREKAILLVATLSRLSRDLHFITSLSKSKINFRVCDMPDATPLTINIMGAIAQYERETISSRTKRALAETKRRGTLLGASNPRVRAGLERLWASKRGKERVISPSIKSKLKLSDEKIFPFIKLLRNQGLSWRLVAAKMNESGIKTSRGGVWHETSLKRVAKRNNFKEDK